MRQAHWLAVALGLIVTLTPWPLACSTPILPLY